MLSGVWGEGGLMVYFYGYCVDGLSLGLRNFGDWVYWGGVRRVFVFYYEWGVIWVIWGSDDGWFVKCGLSVGDGWGRLWSNIGVFLSMVKIVVVC